MPYHDEPPSTIERRPVDTRCSIPSPWKLERLIKGRRLDDRKIAIYEKQGFYSPEFKAARRALMLRKAEERKAREAKRDGSFLIYPDGRKIYDPK